MARYIPTKNEVFLYWKNEIIRNKRVYLDSSDETNYTKMGEDACDYFKISSPNGDTQIEINVFDWAIDFGLL